MNDFVHVAVPIPADVAEAHYKENRTTRALVGRANQRLGTLGFVVGICGIGATACMGIALASLVPMKTVVPYVVEINHETGYVGPAHGIDDAPKMFDERWIRREVYNYILAREAYDPHKDKMNWTQVRDMSDLAIWVPFYQWVNSHDAPKQRLGETGWIDIENVWLSDPLKSANGTVSYKLRWDKTEFISGNPGEPEVCNSALSLQFHPELMLPGKGDTYLNPLGVQVIAYDPPVCHFAGKK